MEVRSVRAGLRPALVATAILLSSTACGGGGGGGGSGGGFDGPPAAATLLQPYGNRSGESFGEAEARHLLRRIAFAAPQREVDRCVRDGMAATVDRLLDAPIDEVAEAAAAAYIEDPLKPSFDELERSWLALLATTNAPAREKMALFWHQRLAVSGRMLDGGSMRWMQEYRDLLRREGLGSWRTMLKQLAKNGAMLVWLSGLPSDKAAPNENYARELWELFSLGVDVVYTQADIQESARAFTGWDARWIEAQEIYELYFDPEAHDDGSKTILGETGTFRDDDVVDITLRHREAAVFLARRLLEGLCYANPEQELVDEVADRAVAGDWELKPLVRLIAKSRAFYAAKSRKTQVADPTLQLVGLVRATEIPLHPWDLLQSADRMGHVPLDPPSVKGWPQGLGWSGEQPLLERAVTVDQIAGTDRQYDVAGDEIGPVGVTQLLPPKDAQGQITGAATVDRVAKLLDVTLSAAERAVLVQYMDNERNDQGVIVPQPFDGNDLDQVEVKVRGLLSILAQHPDAMKN
jgi:uncharacterized protein (DUF1800 family)